MKFLIIVSISLLFAIPCGARIITVDDDGPADFNNIQAAIDDSNDGDIIEVNVGTYTGDGNRDIDFLGKAITVRSTEPNDPNTVAATIIDCNGNWSDNHRGFIFDSNENYDSVLLGITITNGFFGFIEEEGGAIYCNGSSPTISKCRIINNEANYGGGIACIDSNAIISDCTIKGNYTEGCGSNGGGIYCTGSDLLIKRCVITENSSRDRQGGGIFCSDSNCVITQCLISGNKCGEEGGGIACVDANAEINCSTIADNRGYGGGGIRVYSGSVVVRNSILWGNRAAFGNQISLRGNFDNKGKIELSYCDIEGLQQGIYIDWQGELNLNIGNINEDPVFIQAGLWDDNGTPDWIRDDIFLGGGDYHLKSEGWYWHTGRKVWTWDEDVTSRCIDAGNPGSALGDELLTIPSDPNNDWGENLRINMGAYGGTAEASMPPYDWALLSDITNDGAVDFVDFAYLADIYANQDDELPADFDRDGDVDYGDLSLLVDDWLKQTSWYE